jgi:putative transposase
MGRPARNSSPCQIARSRRTFFVTTKTHAGRRLLQSERNANLLIDVLRTCVAAHDFRLHDFVVMPDHFHALLTVDESMTVEKAMQLIKGRFSYLLKKQHGYQGEVWQRGFSEVRADDEAAFSGYRNYISRNPVRAGLAASPEEYPFCLKSLARKKSKQGLKP